MENNPTLVKCPHCGTSFSAGSAIESDVRERLNKEFQNKNAIREQELQKRLDEIEKDKLTVEKWKNEQRGIINRQLEKERENITLMARKQAQEDLNAQMKMLQRDCEEKGNKLKELQLKEFDFLQKEKSLNAKEELLEMEMQKKLHQREEEIKIDAERIASQRADLQLRQRTADMKRKEDEMNIEIARQSQDAAEKARQEEQMKIAEMQKQLDDQKRLVEEMRRKVIQGSMQLQGEAQELELEALLRNLFFTDRIDEVSKGMTGADCILTVLNTQGQECGKIIFESKRTKSFSSEWIMKLKSDMINANANIAVLVTEALPRELSRFGQIDSVWVCTFAEVKSVVMLLRDSLLRIHQVMISQENKGDKMQMLYNYLTGNEFRQRMEGIVDAFTAMQDDLLKEKKSFTMMWEKRQKQLDRVMQNTIAMFGSVKGIAGGAVQDIKGLELGGEQTLLF